MEDSAPGAAWDVEEPDVSDLVTEDDAPVDSVFQEKQQRLLTSALHDSWSGPPRRASESPRPFVAMSNVGLFFKLEEPPLVPDVLLSADVSLPADLGPKQNRSYFVWRFGKPPEIVVEIVSNREGRELAEKRDIYERIRVAHYVVYDPLTQLGDVRLRCFELRGERYVARLDARFEALGLSLVEWRGRFEDHEDSWLRWADLHGDVILTGGERAQREHERADRLAARLRELGVDPDDI